MICGDFATYMPTHLPTQWSQAFKIEILSFMQMFDFLTIVVLCITTNFGLLFTLTFDFILKTPQPAIGLFLTVSAKSYNSYISWCR